MGANEFFTSARGKSLNDAYRSACEDTEEEHGHEQGYSGEINCTDGCIDVTEKFKNSGMKQDDFVQQMLENAEKRDCFAIKVVDPKTNTNKVKTKVQNLAVPGTKKWVLRYSVTDRDGVYLGIKEFKADAIKLARAHTEATGVDTGVYMKKVLEEGKPLVALITYKKGKEEKEGKWFFFGLAPM